MIGIAALILERKRMALRLAPMAKRATGAAAILNIVRVLRTGSTTPKPSNEKIMPLIIATMGGLLKIFCSAVFSSLRMFFFLPEESSQSKIVGNTPSKFSNNKFMLKKMAAFSEPITWAKTG